MGQDFEKEEERAAKIAGMVIKELGLDQPVAKQQDLFDHHFDEYLSFHRDKIVDLIEKQTAEDKLFLAGHCNKVHISLAINDLTGEEGKIIIMKMILAVLWRKIREQIWEKKWT